MNLGVKSLKSASGRIRKILWVLGLHAFSLIIFFVFVDIIFGYFIFYKYVFLVEDENPLVTQAVIKFNDKDYQTVLAQLKANEDSIKPIQNVQKLNTATKTFSKDLKQGDKGDDVLQLQKILFNLGFLKQQPNGIYDVPTVNAVRKFQLEKGIDQSGNVAEKTREALNQINVK